MKFRFLKTLREETRSVRELAVLSLAFKRLWSKASKTGVILAVMFSAIEAALYAVNPIVLRHLVDVLNKGYNFGWNTPVPNPIPFIPASTCETGALWLTAILVLCSILWYGAFNTSTGFARNATYHSQVTFGTETFAHILSLSMDFHTTSKKGAVLARTDEAIRQAQDFLYNSFFGNFLRAGFSITLVLMFTVTIDRRLFAICAVTLALGLYTNFVFGSRVSKEEKAAWQNVSEVTARSLDVMQNVKETKIFGNEAFEVGRRQKDAEEQLVPLRRITMLWRKLTTIENLWQNLGFALAMFFVVLPGVFEHRFTVGQVTQFVSYYLMLFGYFMDLLFKYLNAQRLVPKLREVKKLLVLRPTVRNVPYAVTFPGLRKGFTFEDVTFFYPVEQSDEKHIPPRDAALIKATLTIPKGETTALKGKTGSGKSTIVSLLMRLYDPTTGRIRADGVDISAYEVHSYQRNFAVLSQEAYLFNASVAYNISYSRVGASMEGIVEAAKIAQAHEFISRLPQGYDTIVNERAANISGGQKQRIALARAVLARDAEIVILDEPTTGLDHGTANAFLSELFTVFRGKTVVLVTHDDTVIERADRVILVESGKVEHHIIQSRA